MAGESLRGELIAKEDAFGKRLKRQLLSIGRADYSSLFEDPEASELARRILELVAELQPEENQAQQAARTYLLGCLRFKHTPSEVGGPSPSLQEIVHNLTGLLLRPSE